MSGTMTSAEWIAFIDNHYLADYLAEGGSSVKFIACDPSVDHGSMARALQSCAESRKFVVAAVDSASTRIHMVERIIHSVCDQISWISLVDSVLCRFARANHWQVPEAIGTAGFVAQIEAMNGIGAQQISLELQRRISTEILENKQLTRDFRLAMHWMARSRLETDGRTDNAFQTLTDWLGGRTRLISNLRNFGIFTKITRSNARDLLGSLVAWIRFAGSAGLIINLDAFRMLSLDPRGTGVFNYSNAALLDSYQVFREFIDTTDEIEGFLLNVFVPQQEFLNTDSKSRGIGKYSALMYRVYDEVRDRVLPNPLTALSRISNKTEAIT